MTSQIIAAVVAALIPVIVKLLNDFVENMNKQKVPSANANKQS